MTTFKRAIAALASATLVGGLASTLLDTPASAAITQPVGSVLTSQTFTYKGSPATKIEYVSQDTKKAPIKVSGTIIVPSKAWTGPGSRPIVAFAPGTVGLADRCALSNTLRNGGGGDLVTGTYISAIDQFLAKGYAIAETDYEGMGTPGDHTYVNRDSEGYAVLNVLRAARKVTSLNLPTDGPLGVFGYSQGGNAAGAAAELAATYAPELPIKGIYVGAAPADKALLAKSLDGGMYAGFLVYALAGINAAYPEAKLFDLANQAGAKAIIDAMDTCVMDAVFKFMGAKSSSYTASGRPVSDFLTQEPFKSIVAQNNLGSVKPSMPVMVGQSTMDDVIPYSTSQKLNKDWCAKGGTVEFKPIQTLLPLLPHVFSFGQASSDGIAFLGDRFNGKPAISTCSPGSWF